VDQFKFYGITYCFITFKEEQKAKAVMLERYNIYQNYGISLIRTVEESRMLNEIHYKEIVKMTENYCLSKTSNYYNEIPKLKGS
jgi:hypothetical protein